MARRPAVRPRARRDPPRLPHVRRGAIKLAAELAKEFAIARLINSGTFEETHRCLAKVAGYADFTSEQAQTLLRAANQNSQIRWILTDDDVMQFYTTLLDDMKDVLDPDEVAEFWHNFDNLDEWD